MSCAAVAAALGPPPLFIYELTPPKFTTIHQPPSHPPYKIHAWLNPIGIPQTSSQSQSVLASLYSGDRFVCIVNDRSPDGGIDFFKNYYYYYFLPPRLPPMYMSSFL